MFLQTIAMSTPDTLSSSPAVRVLAPADSSEAQLSSFEAALIAAGEKASPTLGERIRRAERLAFAMEGAEIIAVGALKCPKLEHRTALFKRASAEVSPEPYGLELGWLTGGEEKLPALVSALTREAGERATFVIVQMNERALQEELLQQGFRTGSPPYASSHGDYSNQIYIRGE